MSTGYLSFLQDPDEWAMQDARDALTALAMIRGFDQVDLALVAEILADPEDPKARRELEEELCEETGFRFSLTPRQWGVISTELGGHTDDRSIS